METWLQPILALQAISLLFILFIFGFSISLLDVGTQIKSLENRLFPPPPPTVETKDEITNSPFNIIVAKKKERLSTISNISFHYVNKEQVTAFYNDYFKEPTIENLISEITGEVSGEIKGNVPQLLEAKVGSKDLSKWISTIKIPDISLNGMFLRYQRETIKNEQVTLGLEDVDADLADLELLDRAVNEFRQQFNLEIDSKSISEKQISIRKKAAEKTIQKLEQANGWVLVDGRFKIEKIGELYKLIFHHPVTELLAEGSLPITITTIMPIDGIEQHFVGYYTQSSEELVPLRIYGQVWRPIDRKTGAWELKLTPLAIY
mgnify:CR=1 FL=1